MTHYAYKCALKYRCTDHKNQIKEKKKNKLLQRDINKGQRNALLCLCCNAWLDFND